MPWTVQINRTRARNGMPYTAVVFREALSGERTASISLGFLTEESIALARIRAKKVPAPTEVSLDTIKELLLSDTAIVLKEEERPAVTLPDAKQLASLPLRRWVREYWQPHRSVTNPRTWKGEDTLWPKILSFLGDVPLNKLDAIRWAQFLKLQTQWHPTTKHLAKNAYVQALRYAVDLDVLPSLHKVPTVKGGQERKREPDPLEEHELELLLAAAPSDVHRALYTVWAWNALRPSEATRLLWQDVDFENGMVRVRGTKTRSSNRLVPLLPESKKALLVLWEKLGRPTEGYCFVFRGRPITHPRKGLRLATLRAGLDPKRVYSYSLRHVGVGLWVMHGIPIEAAKMMLGHTPGSHVIEEHYLKLRPAQLADVVSRALKNEG